MLSGWNYSKMLLRFFIIFQYEMNFEMANQEFKSEVRHMNGKI